MKIEPSTVRIEPGDVVAADVEQVLDLAERAEAADRVGPLSEHAQLHLRRGGGDDLIARAAEGTVRGYAHRDDVEAELVVDPGHRREGVGSQLLHALEESVGGPGDGPRIWAHGDRPEAAAFASAHGYRTVRELWQMQRALSGPDAPPLPESSEPNGLRLRAFRVGVDEPAWLTVNARAFSQHPEQGGWTATDLAEREASDWFEPDGLIVAEDIETSGGTMAGFHWTKEHPPADGGGTAMGEVYVLGVDPAYQGRGLGHALTVAGLAHLRARGLETVMLYVDGDNAPAIATYRKLGFERVALDVMYAPSGPREVHLTVSP